MKIIKLYEDFHYYPSDEESKNKVEPTGDSYSEKYMQMLPKEMLRELTRPAKDGLASLRPAVWHEVGPVIDRINFLLNSTGSGLRWKDIMRGSSTLARNVGSSNYGNDVLSFFNSLLNMVLDRTVFKDFKSNPEFIGWSI
jgi:hypothetical protein